MRLFLLPLIAVSLSACGGGKPAPRSAADAEAMTNDFVEWFDKGCLQNAANLSKDGTVLASVIGGDVEQAHGQFTGGVQETEFAGDWTVRRSETVGTTFTNAKRGVEAFARTGNGTDSVAACGIIASAMQVGTVHEAIIGRAAKAGAEYAKRMPVAPYAAPENLYEMPLNGRSYFLEVSPLVNSRGNGVAATLYLRPEGV